MGEQADPPSETPDTLEAFSRDLKQLRGSLTFRELESKAGYSQGALHGVVAGKNLPTEDLLKAFVTGCGGDATGWIRRRRLLADAGSGLDKEFSRAQAEIGRLGDELERLRQVVDDPQTAAYRAERRLVDAQAAETRAREGLQQLGRFADGLKDQIVAANAEAAQLLKQATEEAATQKADLVARGAAAARTAEKIIQDAEALRGSALTEAERIRVTATDETKRMREQAQTEIAQIVAEARQVAVAEAHTLVLSEVDRQRDLAVRAAHQLISAAGTEAQSVEAANDGLDTPNAANPGDEVSAILEDAHKQAEEILERARFQADTIRRVAIQDDFALQAKHAELLAAITALESRKSRPSDQPEQPRHSQGRHRRQASRPVSTPIAQPAQRPTIPPPTDLAGEQAGALVRKFELNVMKYMKELAQAQKSHDPAKVRVAEGALERCRDGLAKARAAVGG